MQKDSNNKFETRIQQTRRKKQTMPQTRTKANPTLPTCVTIWEQAGYKKISWRAESTVVPLELKKILGKDPIDEIVWGAKHVNSSDTVVARVLDCWQWSKISVGQDWLPQTKPQQNSEGLFTGGICWSTPGCSRSMVWTKMG